MEVITTEKETIEIYANLISKIKKVTKAKPKYKSIRINEALVDNIFLENTFTFIRTIKESFNDEDLVNATNNLNEIKIIASDETKENIHGTYFSTNRIEIYKINGEYNKDSIFHELFHASSINIDYEKGIINSGFEISEAFYNERHFSALNEGYTDLLANRYFGMKMTYKTCSNYASTLEKIIGKNKMEHYYLTNDPISLINDLRKYVDEDIIYSTLTFIEYGIHNDHAIKKNYNKLDRLVYSNLIYIYLNKLNYEINNELISKNEAIYNLYNFVDGNDYYEELIKKELPFLYDDTPLDEKWNKFNDVTYSKSHIKVYLKSSNQNN